MRTWSLKPEKDKIYLISPYGLGDTMILCGMKRALEEVYHCQIVYIIKPSHVPVMEMYRIRQYISREFTREELLHIGKKCPVPQKGKLFVAHPDFHADPALFRNFLDLTIPFMEMYRRMLCLQSGFPFDFPEAYPEPGRGLLKKIGNAEIENIVLIAPEMNACVSDMVRMEYFEKRIEDLLGKNERVVLNVTGGSLKGYERLNADLTLEELTALSMYCKKVISSRSGFCDLIFRQARERLEIIYPNLYFWRLYNMRTVFPDIEIQSEETILSFGEKLRERGYVNCAVYGMGIIGQHFLKNLQCEGFPVLYAIDRDAENMTFSIPLFCPSEELPETDAVIVTPKEGFTAISTLMKKKIKGDVLHYSELL